MLKYAVMFGGPIAIRYPRGEAYDGLREYREPIDCGRAEWIYREQDIALFAVGSMVKTAEQVREKLKAQGFGVSLINARFVKPIDREAVLEACKEHRLIVSLEENVAAGGYGEKVLNLLSQEQLAVDYLQVALPDAYIEHGNVEKLKSEIGMDADSICRNIRERMSVHMPAGI